MKNSRLSQLCFDMVAVAVRAGLTLLLRYNFIFVYMRATPKVDGRRNLFKKKVGSHSHRKLKFSS